MGGRGEGEREEVGKGGGREGGRGEALYLQCHNQCGSIPYHQWRCEPMNQNWRECCTRYGYVNEV